MVYHVHPAVATREVLPLTSAIVTLQHSSYPRLHHHGNGQTLQQHDDVTLLVDFDDGVAHERNEEVDEQQSSGEDEEQVKAVDEARAL